MIYLLVLFTCYRLTRLIVIDDGPFDLAAEIRTWAYDHSKDDGWIQRGLACGHCVSFWLAFALAWLWPQPYLLSALGLAGATSLLWKVLHD